MAFRPGLVLFSPSAPLPQPTFLFGLSPCFQLVLDRFRRCLGDISGPREQVNLTWGCGQEGRWVRIRIGLLRGAHEGPDRGKDFGGETSKIIREVQAESDFEAQTT